MFAIAEPYRRARLMSFLRPVGRTQSGAGFQTVQAMIAIGSGGFFGVGLGESVQKIFYLPEAHTDMILAIIGEELGLIGITAVAALYGMIAYAGLRAAKMAKDRYAKLLSVGITSLILCQATLNFFAVMGMAPLTGVPLPFISYGNSNLIVLLGGDGSAAERGRHRRQGAGRVSRTRCGRSTAERGRVPRVVIAAGGTAGHVVPALAVADALRASGAEVEFIGSERAEAELVPAAGYKLRQIKVVGIDRQQPAARRARACAGRAGAAARPRCCCAASRADAVIGGGGYVAGPVGLAAALLRHPALPLRGGQPSRDGQPPARALREAGVPVLPDPGSRGRQVRGSSGRPVPAGTGQADRAAARMRFGVGGVGAVPARVRRLARRPLPQRGGNRGVRRRGALRRPARERPARLSDDLRARLDALGSPPHYHLHEYIEPFADALAAADLVVARAGGSVLEVAAAGLPGRARALSARDRGPSDPERSLDGARGRRGGGAGQRARRAATRP